LYDEERPMNFKVPSRSVLVTTVVVVASGGLASAQTPFSSSITGTVRDKTGAVLQGATVTIAAPTLIGGQQSATSSAHGEYRFTLLPAGVYAITIQADNFRPLRQVDVRVASGVTVTLDHELDIAGLSEATEIRGDSPVVDVKSAGVPVRLDEDLLENLPTSRSVANLLNLVPGISSDVAFGGSQKSNEILLDGVRMTEGLFQDPILRANYNWVQEVNVVALGAPAEYGGFTGAAGYASLRSGSNRFSGLGEFWTTRPNWLDTNTDDLSAALQRQFDSRQILEWRDSSAQLGGPFVTNRLWFFAGVQHAKHEDRPAGFTGPGSTDEDDLQLILKPTASVSPSVRLDGFIQHGRRRVTGAYIDAFFPIESSNDIWNPQTSWNAHLTWTLNDRTVVEARHGGYDAKAWEDPHPPATIDGPVPRYDYGTQTWSQNANWYFRSDSRVNTTTASMTHFAENVLGLSHQLKVGIEYEAMGSRQELRYPGGRNYYDDFGAPDQVEVWGGYNSRATTGRNVLHAHDTWALTNRLTLSPGVRFEWNRGSVPNQPEVFKTTTVAPRFGIAWDVTGDHRTVARLHYGLYYDAIFASRIMQEDRSEVNPSVWYQIVGPDQYVELSRSSTQDRFEIDDDLEHSHVKQLVVGLERELFGGVSLQAQYIRRRFDTFMGLIDTGSIYAPIQLRDPGPDGQLNTSDDGGLLDVFNLTNPGNSWVVYTNPDDAFNRYDAVQIVGRKRYSRNWQMQSSYTWSKNRGTVGNRWHVNAARFDLGNPGRFVNPNLGINAMGRATYDPTHEVKVLGSYRLPFWGGVMTSGVYRYMTGQAWGRTASVTGFTQGRQRIRIEPQGMRRAPAINRLDLRVEKAARIPRIGTTLGLFFDVFNVWNQGVPNSDTNAINDFSGARFGEPAAWVDPRMLRVGIRASF
jgi:Carboxypeptidase regulatory-like domain